MWLLLSKSTSLPKPGSSSLQRASGVLCLQPPLITLCRSEQSSPSTESLGWCCALLSLFREPQANRTQLCFQLVLNIGLENQLLLALLALRPGHHPALWPPSSAPCLHKRPSFLKVAAPHHGLSHTTWFVLFPHVWNSSGLED